MNPLNHVAIIMDGNGRWGLINKKSRNLGHKEGLVVINKIIKKALEIKIKYLTLFTFSTDNWKRPSNEIKYLFKLFQEFLENKITYLNKKKIKLKVIGEKNFSHKLNKLIKKAEKTTSKNDKIQINIALNYGSKKEIVNTIKLLLMKKISISEKNIANNLYTKNIPDPEILIRTGDTQRLSNFLLWQLSYTEIFFVKKLWPDFNENDFLKIINKFKRIKRNFGSL